jgi:16S rRNA C967 or C1407 C5-methylase (RsmB/RsmF family)
VFAREVNPGLTGLVKKLEAATQKHSDCSFRAVVVLLSDDDKMEGKLKELVEKEKLKKLVLTLDSPQGPPKYKIAKDADVTVILYDKKKVKKNFAYEKGKLTDQDVDAVLVAVKEILPQKKGSE